MVPPPECGWASAAASRNKTRWKWCGITSRAELERLTQPLWSLLDTGSRSLLSSCRELPGAATWRGCHLELPAGETAWGCPWARLLPPSCARLPSPRARQASEEACRPQPQPASGCHAPRDAELPGRAFFSSQIPDRNKRLLFLKLFLSGR